MAFINELIIELQKSGLCCGIYGIQSTPPGYADDIATACDTKCKMDKTLGIVNDYGNKWRFHFNAKKSAIMTYGENPKSNVEYSKQRVFKLGNARVSEKNTYDHVGVKAQLYKNDPTRVNEKIIKGRRAFNACAGIGIRKSGLTMMTCNLIYWSIVIPIITFGSEIWCLSDQDYDNLNSFQRCIGKRIQRFPPRTPNCTSFYGLGWTRITTYILVKKLLFALSILRMKHDNVVRKIFIERVYAFMQETLVGQKNNMCSPTFEIMNAAKRFGVSQILSEMCSGVKPIMTKGNWSKFIWEKAWYIEDLYWESTRMINKDMDLLSRVTNKVRYNTWWEISDRWPDTINVCETMSRLVSHASKLKTDDVRLKGLTPGHRMCAECDLYIKEDLFHMVMQCPTTEEARILMYEDIFAIDNRLKEIFADKQSDVFNWLIGKTIPAVGRELMYLIWITAGRHICDMYRQKCRNKTGIG